MATVQFHLRRAGACVGIVIVVVLGIPALSRILGNLHPVVFAVLDVAGVLQRLGEELAEVVVVGRVFEAEVSHVGEVFAKLLGETLAEVLDGRGLLLLANLFVLLLIGGSFEALPGQAAAEEVHEDVAQGLEVVSARLLAAEMGVDAHITGGSGERLALAVGNVLLGLGVAVLLGHAKVNHVDDIGRLCAGAADDEVVRLDVSVDEVALVYRLNSGQHLLGHHYNRLDCESATAVVKEVFERRAEKINDEDVVQALLAKVINIRNTG